VRAVVGAQVGGQAWRQEAIAGGIDRQTARTVRISLTIPVGPTVQEDGGDVGHGQATIIQRPAFACVCVAIPAFYPCSSRCSRVGISSCGGWLAAALAEQREQPRAAPSSTATSTGVGIQAGMVAHKSGIVRSQRAAVPQPQTAPRSRGQHRAPEVTGDDVDIDCLSSSSDANSGDDDETARRRGRGTLTQEERRERRCVCHTHHSNLLSPACSQPPCRCAQQAA
jgi:hypothetical protein